MAKDTLPTQVAALARMQLNFIKLLESLDLRVQKLEQAWLYTLAEHKGCTVEELTAMIEADDSEIGIAAHESRDESGNGKVVVSGIKTAARFCSPEVPHDNDGRHRLHVPPFAG